MQSNKRNGLNGNEQLLQRITLNPEVCFGKPTIRNMRYPVEMILDLLSAGMTVEELLEDYPELEQEDILACLALASQLLKEKRIQQILETKANEPIQFIPHGEKLLPVTPATEKPDIKALAGIWKNKNITLESLRQEAWGDRL